jgi:hypothetical protein
LRRTGDAAGELAELRRSYEPYVVALSTRLMMPAPAWRHAAAAHHNWHTSPRRDGGAHL